MRILFSSMAIATLLALASAIPAHAATITQFADRASFTAASSGLTTINFEGIVPGNGFQNFTNPAGLTVSGVNFTTSGTGPFGSGFVTVQSATYAAGQPIYNTGTGANLVWGPPNQPGTAFLNLTLPSGTTAFATDLWTAQPFASSVNVMVSATDSTSSTFTVSTVARPTASFFGATSSAPISSVVFQIPAGQVALILDNTAFGTAAAGPGPSPVPEPASWLMSAAGLAAPILLRRLRVF